MISNFDKFVKAVKNLKTTAMFNLSYQEEDTIIDETLFNKIDWVTGKDADDTAITTKTNPHSELSWNKVSEEMRKL